MPVIPTSGRQIRERVSGMGSVRAQMPSNIGSTDLSGLSQVANQVSQFAIEERNRADEVVANAFKTKLRDKYNEDLHSKEGYLAQQQMEAVKNYQVYNDGYNSFVDKELKALGNDRLRAKMQVVADEYRSNFKKATDVHSVRQQSIYDDNQTKAGLASIENDAMLNAIDPGLPTGEAFKSVKEQETIVDAYAARKGMSKEDADRMKLEASSSLHYKVISQALTKGNDLLAKDYYKEAKKSGQIDGDTAAKLEKILHGSSVKGESQRIVDKIMSEGLSSREALQKAREVKDPEVRDATVSRLKNRIEEEKRLRKEEGIASFDNIIDQIEQYKTIDHLPEEQKAVLTGKRKEATEKLLAMISKGHEPDTDPVVYQDLYLMASNRAFRDKFLQTDINEYAHKLNTADRKMFIKMREDIRAGKGSSHEKLFDSFLSNTSVINHNLNELGVSDKKKRARFSKMVQDQALKWQEENKRKIPQQELQGIIDSLSGNVLIEGLIWGTNKERLYEVEDKEPIRGVSFDDIPGKDLELIKQAFSAKGMDFSEQAAEQMYLKKLQRTLK